MLPQVNARHHAPESTATPALTVLGRARRAAPRPALTVLMLILLLAPGDALAQAMPDASEVIRCYTEIRQRIDAWGHGDPLPAAPTIADPDGTVGAAVTLRLGGRVVGRGSAIELDTPHVEHALLEAWRDAEGAILAHADEEALDGDRRRALAARITIDLEVAGPLTPLVGQTFDAVAARLSPGIHGVALRSGGRLAPVFPGLQLTTGLTPTRALRVAAGMLDLPPVDLDAVRREHDVTPYAFRTHHLAEPRPGSPPEFLHRGGAIVPLTDVTARGLRRTADAIARHLATHEWDGDEPFGLTGNYEPTTGIYDPAVGGPRSQALVAMALARHARTPGVDEGQAETSRRLAPRILRSLTAVATDESDPASDPVAAAMWLCAWAETLDAGAVVGEADAPGGYAHVCLRSILGAIDDPQAWAATSPGARALIAHALARASDHALSPGLDTRARAIVRELFRTTNTTRLPALMPWLGWAELALADGDEVPAAIALRDFRDLAWSFQLEAHPAGSQDVDLAGGIVLSRGGARLPTWQTLRPLAFLATMLAHPDLTDDQELPTQVASLRHSLRFLIQLTVREAELHMMLSERRALGGLRRALWDQTQSLDANALALLTLTETLNALAARAGGGSAP